MKYGYNKENKKYTGVYSDDYELPIELDFVTVGVEGFFKPIINSTFNGWEEGLTGQDLIEAQEKEQEDAIDVILETYKIDGLAYFRKTRNFIKRNADNGTITKAQLRGIKNILQPALLPLKDGNWDIAQDSINAITPPTNAKMLTLYNRVKDDVDAYVLNKY